MENNRDFLVFQTKIATKAKSLVTFSGLCVLIMNAMRTMKFFQRLFITLSLLIASNAYALDGNDELKPEASSQDLRFVKRDLPTGELPEKNFPQQAALIEQLIRTHVASASARDYDGYLATFHEDIAGLELHRAYAKRVIGLPNLKIELLAFEFQVIQPRAGIVHTRQLSSYDLDGKTIVDDAIITYRVKEIRGQWLITDSDRKRLVNSQE